MVMKKKALNRDIQKSFSKSKGRFISIACLIALGSFALVGLQVTGPDMRKTTSDYLQQYHAADLSVIGSMGIDQENAKTIDSLDGTEQVTYGYLKDVVLKDTSESCRIFSLDEDISKYEVVSGRLPEKADEIAFADADKDNYQIGDQITFEEKTDTSGNTVLKNKTFTITGFVHSTEILSCVNQGQSTAGSGELNSYAVVTEDAFDCDYYMIARITFRDTQGLDPYSDAYTDKIQAHKNQLETLLENAPAQRLDAVRSEYQEKIDDGSQQYEPGMAQISAAQQELDSKSAQLQVAKAQLDDAESQLNDAAAALTTAKNQLSQASAQVNTAKSQLAAKQSEYNTKAAELKSGEQQLESGRTALEQAKQELEAQRSDGEAKLLDARETLAEKKQEYREKLAEYNDKKADADIEIADNSAELDDAQADVDKLSLPTFSVYTRREVPGAEGYRTYSSVSDIVDALADVFPIFMYFVAALVTLTTMTRFVDEERINSGTLKALGYEERDIIKKFSLYGLFSGLTGAATGIAAGLYLLPRIANNAYAHGFTVPKIETPFHLKWAVIAVILAMLSTVLPAVLVAKKELQEKPSALLQPKPPANGSKILLERITPIWNRMSFTHKVTARNIFRYKKRMLMTIFGVCGSVTILFAGLSVQHSISGINDRQFGEIIRYDLIAAENDNLDTEEQQAINEKLSDKDVVESYAPIYYEEYSVTAGKSQDSQTIKLLCPENTDDFSSYISLDERKSGKSIALTDNGVVISERLSKLLDVSAGDTITLKDSAGNPQKMQIAAVTEMYTGHFLFVSPAYYQQFSGQDFSSNAYLIRLCDSSSENANEVAASFMKLGGIAGIVQNTTMISQINVIVKSLNKIMWVLIVVAVLLGVVILYNLTNINVSERIRELSTIKVLGFYDKEVTLYIYRETIILTLLGILVGFLTGDWLYQYIITVVPPDEVMFNPALSARAFLIPFVLISMITAVLGAVINRRLQNVDMLDALKSVE